MSFLKSGSAPRGVNVPSPTPSTSSNNGGKRKRPADDVTPSTIYSQPRETGTGNHVFTQVTYAVEHLKANQDRWISFQEITDYLNIPSHDTLTRQQLQSIFQLPNHSKIEWGGKDKYRYRPRYNVRNAEELKGYLQNQKSAQGLAVRDLKDGWPNAADAIAEMEKKKELLVTHNKKDGSARTVWINDPTLMHKVDPDFQNEWHKIQLPPNPDDLRTKLVAAGLKPSSAPREALATKPKEKKKKAPRRGGKQTNTHMTNILKDYSHKRK
jgi:transcription initiation factor TFIIE subunit beta